MSSRGGSPAAPAPAPGQEPNDEDFEAVNASVPPAASDDEEDVDVNAVAEEMDDDDGAGADAGAVSEDDDQAEDVSRVVLFWGGGWAERESKEAKRRKQEKKHRLFFRPSTFRSSSRFGRLPAVQLLLALHRRVVLCRALSSQFSESRKQYEGSRKHDREDD